MVTPRSRLDLLEIVDLRGTDVSDVGPFDDITLVCPRIRSLDLTSTLMTSFASVLAIAAQLPELAVLRVRLIYFRSLHFFDQCSGNAFSNLNLPELPPVLSSLRSLTLNSTNISWHTVIRCMTWAVELPAQMKMLAPCFPQLEELHLCGNTIKEVE
jgi:hypothetical protein